MQKVPFVGSASALNVLDTAHRQTSQLSLPFSPGESKTSLRSRSRLNSLWTLARHLLEVGEDEEGMGWGWGRESWV